MQTVLYYLIGLGAFALVTGGIITVFAMRSAPEGFEDETGFVGVTKGDKVLLEQFSRAPHYSPSHGRMDLAA
jgi:hypothetical protein